MRNLTIILFASFYFIASAGITVEIHYCGGNLALAATFAPNGSCCCGDKEKQESCCDDETYFLHYDNDQQIIQNFRTADNSSSINSINNPSTTDYLKLHSNDVKFEFSDLPPPHKQHIWLLNCSLTFYG